ncbi:M13 family peptidase [Lysobacter sp. TY2-98]|uniref:M13 family metallopeptidase n=1 Tax=Lysobacter sp. TY2-98 TaxID=2290922 RepID=UPI000E20B4E8|nr:M13 family metallopeptidase [Lysobacter sp. TY2-98]AXK72141.1 M13 family peptidase [Lysobacter sp. TY2-98]
MGRLASSLRLALVSAGLVLSTGGAVAAGTSQDFLAAHLDTSVDPGVDFFQYANGGWLKAHPIPKSESSWGIGNEVDDELYARLRTISESAAKTGGDAGSDTQKIGDFWATAMDTAKADQLGVRPLDTELARIDAIRSSKDVLDTVFAFKPIGVSSLFRVGISQDDKDSATMAVRVSQGGLGLPERDFYFNPEAGVAKLRTAYVAHIARSFELLGRKPNDAKAAAEKVMAFETALAKASRKLEDLRDPEKNYNKMSPAELTAKYTPSIDWTARLAAWNLKPSYVIVGQPEFFAAEEKLLRATPVPVLQDYLRYHLVDSYAEYLSTAFDTEYFDFHGRAMSGQQEQRPRWKRVLDEENDAMGMVLGRIFVGEYFPATSKQRYAAMVEAIRDTYRARIERLDWMGADTKTKALAKLASITPKVGYPDHWKDYSALVVGRESYAANVMNAQRWQFQDNLSKFGKPVDRTEWDMTPQTYNAYYNPSNNEIVLPAAIFMVPGVPDAEVDDAVAYGYVAASTIGHEITHGFDDEGRQFDAKGNLSGWWTAEDAARFTTAAQKMVDQFNAYEPLPGLHINGKASLGENIADYGGVLLGLEAFQKTAQYKEGKSMGGLTPTQRYFLGYALGWMSQQREEKLRQRLLSDVHAPAKWRVLGPMSNIPEFYDAFHVKPGQPMWREPADRVRIW